MESYLSKGRRNNLLSCCYDCLPDTDYAYCTLLTRPGYLEGVQVLARSLWLVGASHPLIVLHTKGSLPASVLTTLRCEGCHLHEVEPYAPPSNGDGGQYALSYYCDCWNKMHLWRLERYKRLVYLDADMMLMQNPDCLFLEHPPDGSSSPAKGAGGHDTRSSTHSCAAAAAACMGSTIIGGAFGRNSTSSNFSSDLSNSSLCSSLCSNGTCSDDLWSVCDCYHARSDAVRDRCPFLCPQQQRHAASSTACCSQDCEAARKQGIDSYFNAGLLVLTPSFADLDAMEAALATPEGAASIGQFAEQDFLNWFWQRAQRWRRLSWTFNAQWHSIGPHSAMWQSAADDITVVHFNDKHKPWHKPAHERRAHPLEARWADISESIPPRHAPDELKPSQAAEPFAAAAAGGVAAAPLGDEGFAGLGAPVPMVAFDCGVTAGLGRAGAPGNNAALVE